MAIEFARVKAISRGKGGNVCRTAAYNARTKIKDQTTGTRYNFTHKSGNLHHEIVLPDYASDRFKNLSVLMNEVEKHNDRINSQLAREIVLALPDNLEITLEDRIILTRRFIDAMGFTGSGVGVVFDIHAPDEEDKNNHAHLIVLDQHRFKQDGLGFCDFKARDLQPDFRYNKIMTKQEKLPGKVWRQLQNDYFIEKGLDIRVDDISTIPYEHIGPVRMRSILNQAITRNEMRSIGHLEIIKDASSALKAITRNQSVFTKADVHRALKKLEDPSMRKEIVEQVLSSAEVILLHALSDTNEKTLGSELHYKESDTPAIAPLYYTTKDIRSEEERLLRIACKVAALPNICATRETSKNLERFKPEGDLHRRLSDAQLTVLNSLLTSECGVRVFRGRAGTGKSHLLGFSKFLSEEAGINVIGLAPTHKAVLELRDNGFYTSETLKGFLFKLYNGKAEVPNGSLVILDEAGMVDTESYLELFKIVKAKDCNIILAGDELQLTSVSRGGMFEVFADKFGSVELSEIRRQDAAWAKELACSFANGNVRAGIKLLKENHGICHTGSLNTSICKLVEDFTVSNQDLKHMLVITVRNKEVDILNDSIREVFKVQGRLVGHEYLITKDQGSYQSSKGYMKGDRIVFGSTPKDFVPKNGDFATIIFASKDKFVTKLDSNDTEVTFDPREMHNFKHGYASTTYKAQGASIKNVYVLHNGIGNSRSSYVAMTRFVEGITLYTNNAATKSVSDLAEQLSLKDEKSASLKFMTSEEMDLMLQKGNDQDLAQKNQNATAMQRLGSWFKGLTTNIGDRLHSNPDYYSFEAAAITSAKVEEMLMQTAAEARSRLDDITTSSFAKDALTAHQFDVATADNKLEISTNLKKHESSIEEQVTVAPPISEKSIKEQLTSILPNLLQYQDKLGSEDSTRYMEYQASRSKSESAHEFLNYASPLYQLLLASILMNKDSSTAPYFNGITLESKLQQEQKEATNVDIKLITQAQESFASKIQNFHGYLNSTYQHFEEKLDSLQANNKVNIYRALVRDVSLIHQEQLASISLKLPKAHIEVISKTIYNIINLHETQNGRGRNPEILTNRDIEHIATKAYETLCKGDWWNNEIMQQIEFTKHLTQSSKHEPQIEQERQIAIGEVAHLAQSTTATHLKSLAGNVASSSYYAQSNAIRNNFAYLEDTKSLKTKIFLGAELIAKNLLGEPNKHLSNRRTLRFGETGKLAIQISGTKSGIWYDFSESRGGDLFELVARERSCSFIEAKDYIKSVIGIPNNITYLRSQDTNALYKQKQAEEQNQQRLENGKIQRANILYNKSLTLANDSIAACYLRDHRKIQNIDSICSPDLKISEIWSKETKTKMPVLIAFARDKQNKITGGQQIYLSKETAQKADLKVNKCSFGKISGSFVVIQDSGSKDETTSNITIIAEGLETALSLQEAGIKGKILCSLGVSNIQNYSPFKGEKIMIAADNDGKDAMSQRSIMDARETLEDKGAVVSIIIPKELGDWNDVLKNQGVRAIQDQLNPELITLSKDDGMDRVIEKISTFVEDSLHVGVGGFIEDLNELKTLAPKELEHILAISKSQGIEIGLEQANTKIQNIKVQKQQEFDQFLKYHQSQLREIASLDPSVNIQTLIEDLKTQSSHLSPKEASKFQTAYLEALWIQTFRDKVLPELTNINKALSSSKTPSQFIKAIELEKEFYSKLRTKYSRLSKTTFSKEQYKKLLHNVVFHKDNSNFIENITKDIETLIKHQIWSEEKIMQTMMHHTQNSGHYFTMEGSLFKACKNHFEYEVMQDLKSIDTDKHQSLEKDNTTFTDHKTYLEHRINDKDLGHYLTDTELHKLLAQIYREEHKIQEQQRQQQLQKEQATIEQLELHKEADKGFDKGM